MSQIAGNVLISIKKEIYFSQFYLRCHSSLDNKLLHVALAPGGSYMVVCERNLCVLDWADLFGWLGF